MKSGNTNISKRNNSTTATPLQVAVFFHASIDNKVTPDLQGQGLERIRNQTI